jgi:hypothetical protein
MGLWSLRLSLPRMQTKQSKTAWVNASTGCSQGCSFAEVLQSKSCSKLKWRPSHCTDIFRMTTCSKVGNGGVDQRLVVDCFELENSLMAASSSKKMKGGISINRWVKHLLGFFQLEMVRVLTWLFEGLLVGFEGIPLRKRVRAVLKSLDGFKGIEFGPSLKPNPSGHLKCFRKAQTGFEGFGLGLSRKPKTSGRLKSSHKVQLRDHDRPFQGKE